MSEPNRLLRAARERTPSRRSPGAYMSREELAEAVGLWIAEHDGKQRSVAFDANHLGKLERGTVRCPRQLYIDALCAVLRATPAELGFNTANALVPAEPEHELSDPVEGGDDMVGKRHRLVSTRKAAGFSQERLAEKVGVERSTVMRWEHGETRPQPWARPKLARALGISDQSLSKLLGESAEPESAASAFGPTAGEVVSPHRRDFFKQSVTFPALGFDELRHLGAALDDARRYFDIEVVGYFKNQLNNCVANDGAHGPAQVLPPMLGIVAAIERHVREVKADVRRELLTVGAQAAEFVGWLYRDAGQLRLSGQWRDRATEWAQEAGDWPMQGYILLKKSQAAWDERDGLRMLTLAQAAHHGPWQLPPLVQAEVAQQEARGLAMTGESSATVDAKLNEAWEIFTAAEATMSEWGCHYDRTLLTMQTALCYCEAGRPGQAVQLYREHLDDEQISRRDRGYFLSLMAGASAHAAEPDNAASAGYEALTIAVETHSLRTIDELKRVCALLEPWHAQPAVHELREAVFLLSGN